MSAPYVYNATLKRVIDGDTIVLDVDLGFDTWRLGQSFRLLGCNAQEHNRPGGAEAKAHLTQLLPVDTQLTLRSVKPDKYGERYDAAIAFGNGQDLSALLIQTQWAAAWDGQGVKPVPPWPRTIA